MPPQAKKRTSTKTSTTRTTRATTPTNDDDKYAPSTWGTIGTLEDITCPSGQLALVRRPGVQGLMKAGVIHDMDGLSALVDKKHIKRVKGGADEVNPETLMQDPASLERVMHVADRIMCHIVVKPSIQMTPNDSTRREPGVIYADMVDVEDKFFLMNYAVGGTRDVERFRGELEKSVGGLESGEDVELPAK